MEARIQPEESLVRRVAMWGEFDGSFYGVQFYDGNNKKILEAGYCCPI